MAEVELQSELMTYADRFVSIISQAFEDFETLKPKPQARQIILSDLVYSLSAVSTIAAEPNPIHPILISSQQRKSKTSYGTALTE